MLRESLTFLVSRNGIRCRSTSGATPTCHGQSLISVREDAKCGCDRKLKLGVKGVRAIASYSYTTSDSGMILAMDNDTYPGNASVELSLGNLRFSADGPPDWISEQLERVLESTSMVATAAPSLLQKEEVSAGSAFDTSLVAHIKEKNGESVQVQRFLATADWLRRRGEKVLTTSLVSSTLREGHQKKLSNPSDALNGNVSKGFCEKSGNSFFITPDGLTALGYQ